LIGPRNLLYRAGIFGVKMWTLGACTASNDAITVLIYNTKKLSKCMVAGNRQQLAMDYSGRSRSKYHAYLQRWLWLQEYLTQIILMDILVRASFHFHGTKTWLDLVAFSKNCVYTTLLACLWRTMTEGIIFYATENPSRRFQIDSFYCHTELGFQNQKTNAWLVYGRWSMCSRAIWLCQRLGWGGGTCRYW